MKFCDKAVMDIAYSRYLDSNLTSLGQCYDDYSDFKRIAFDYARGVMAKYNGKCLKIISYNNQMFTVGFIGYIDGLKAFFYITKGHERFIYIK